MYSEPPRSFDDLFASTEIILDRALEDATEDDLPGLGEVAREVEHGRSHLTDARKASDSGDREVAWEQLVLASRCAGAAQASVSGAWVRGAFDAAEVGSRGGQGKGANFRRRRAEAARRFLERSSQLKTQGQARAELDSAISGQAMRDVAGARKRIFEEHPEVRQVFDTLPAHYPMSSLINQ